jgi:hypothetical protein
LVLNNALANEICNRLVVASVIVYDPLQGSRTKKRVCVFDIGLVTQIELNYFIVRTDVDFEYLIKIRTFKAISPLLFQITAKEITVNSKELRYLFRNDPIVNDGIILSNERFSEITCAFFNGKQLF